MSVTKCWVRATIWCCSGGLKRYLARENTDQMYPGFAIIRILLSGMRQCERAVYFYMNWLHRYIYGLSQKSQTHYEYDGMANLNSFGITMHCLQY